MIFKALSDGITINSFSIAGIKIDGLYIKLDKKLTLSIDNIDLTKMKSSPDSTTPKISDIANIIRRTITIASMFDRLEIVNIQYEGENSSIFFDGKQYNIDIPYILASFELNNDGDDILLDIKTLKIKKEDLDIKGRILFVNKGNIFAFDLESYINNRTDNVINYQGETNFKYLTVVLDSTSLNSIDILAPYIKILDTDIYEWIYKKASFKQVTINRAYLTLKNIKSKHIEQDIIDNLYASGIVDDVSLKIEDELSPITTKQVAVIFKKGNLALKTNNASYEGIIADSGIVNITNFLANQPLLSLDITSKQAVFDDRIGGILRYYGIDIPVVQKDGLASGNIKLDILLPTEKFETVITPNGSFSVSNANIQIGGVDLFVQKAQIDIEGNQIMIADSQASFKDIIDTTINLAIDTEKQTIDVIALPSKFLFSTNGLDIINFNNQPIQAHINFSSNGFSADFNDYDAKITTNDAINITLNNLSKIAPYAPILSFLAINNGKLAINIKDVNDISFVANIQNLKYPIYNADKTNIDTITLEGKIDKRFVRLWDSNNRLRTMINSDNGNVDLQINGLLVNIDEILKSNIPIFANITNNNNTSTNNESSEILVNAKNTQISLFGYDIALEEAMLKTTPSGFISNGKNKNGIANIIFDKGIIHIEADNFNDTFINNIFHKEVVSGGTFGLNGVYEDGKFLGDISIRDTSIKNMASLQNILTLIDTIPSLMVFKLPGFSKDGYEIENADIRIGVTSDFVVLEKINTTGSSIDIEGEGVIDLSTQELNIDLSLSTMKSLSSILSNIPIIGYLLLGDDGKITTKLAITGKLDDPQTDLSLLEDAASIPLNTIERIFSPFQTLVEELKKESKKKGMQ